MLAAILVGVLQIATVGLFPSGTSDPNAATPIATVSSVPVTCARTPSGSVPTPDVIGPTMGPQLFTWTDPTTTGAYCQTADLSSQLQALRLPTCTSAPCPQYPYSVQVTDTTGTSLWGPLGLDVFTVPLTVQGPPTQTVGLTTIGSTFDSQDSNYLTGSKITIPAGSFSLQSISVYVGAIDATSNRSFQVAIYADASGHPGARVASSASGTLTANAWNTLPLSAPLTSGSSYWLMYNSNGRSGSVNNLAYTNATMGIGAYSTNSSAFGSWPATFPAYTLSSSQYSIYATITTSAGPACTVTLTAKTDTTATHGGSLFVGLQESGAAITTDLKVFVSNVNPPTALAYEMNEPDLSHVGGLYVPAPATAGSYFVGVSSLDASGCSAQATAKPVTVQ